VKLDTMMMVMVMMVMMMVMMRNLKEILRRLRGMIQMISQALEAEKERDLLRTLSLEKKRQRSEICGANIIITDANNCKFLR
jgi:hypothetical protein